MPVLQRRSQMMQDGIGRNAREEHGSGTMEVHPAGGMHPFTMRYLPLAESDAEEAARLYTEIFSADEPTTQRRGPDTAVFLHSIAKRLAAAVAHQDVNVPNFNRMRRDQLGRAHV